MSKLWTNCPPASGEGTGIKRLRDAPAAISIYPRANLAASSGRRLQKRAFTTAKGHRLRHLELGARS